MVHNFCARAFQSDLVSNVACMDEASEAVCAAAADSTARPHSSPTVDVRDALRQGWVLWCSSSISADHRLHAAISPPSVPTVAMASAGSTLKGWDLSNLGTYGANPFMCQTSEVRLREVFSYVH